jgi:hypothetical protein
MQYYIFRPLPNYAILHNRDSPMKAKGQSAQVAKPEPLALASIARVAQKWKSARLLSLRTLVRSQPRVPHLSPTYSANCLRGLTSGSRQRQGFYAHCHFGPCAGKRQGPNDVSQLPYRNGKGWVLRTEQGSAVQVPALNCGRLSAVCAGT